MVQKFKARVLVTLRKTILDPQGKAVHHALQSLGMTAVEDVRIGKLVEMVVTGSTRDEVERAADEAAKKLLANPVMEDYSVSVEKLP